MILSLYMCLRQSLSNRFAWDLRGKEVKSILAAWLRKHQASCLNDCDKDEQLCLNRSA